MTERKRELKSYTEIMAIYEYIFWNMQRIAEYGS